MLRRNPTRIELSSSDRDELEEHLRAAAGSTPAATIKDPAGYTTPSPVPGPQTSNPLLHLLRNTRAVYDYELEDGGGGGGLVLELDETRFDFGTSYELECETAEPERVKEVLERLLTVAGVPYEYSRSNKFACFMAGKLLP